MADIADLAQVDMERDAPYILAAARKPAGPTCNGLCHNCGESLPPDVLFCDTDCRDDYEYAQRRQVANGRADT